MNFLNKLEKKFGKYAIPNISWYLILAYACGYLLIMINPNILNYLTLNPYLIMHGEVWRLVTWIIIPPETFDVFTIVMLYFYFSIGTTLERTWGTFYYNVYLFMGMFFTVIASFIVMGIFYASGVGTYEAETVKFYFQVISMGFSTYYVNMTIFLGFAATFPEAQLLLMFIVPVKAKWLGILYAVLILDSFIKSSIIGRILIVASVLNFVVFFAMTRKNLAVRFSPKQIKRRQEFKSEVKKARPKGITKHKCAICGKNSVDNPDTEFRFCSKCNGNYEYCQDHLFSHTHVK